MKWVFLFLLPGLMGMIARGAGFSNTQEIYPTAEPHYVISPPYDFSRLKEKTLLILIKSPDRMIRNSAFLALEGTWWELASQAKDDGKHRTNGKTDKSVKMLFDILKKELEMDDAILASWVLAFTPPDRAPRGMVVRHLQSAVTSARNLWTRVHSANALATSFWARGEAPDDVSVKAIDQLLTESDDGNATYYVLWGMINWGSDCLPFKGTLEKFSGSSDDRLAGTAKRLLAGMNHKIDAPMRKKLTFRLRWN
jgi:hypothetical protein